MRELSVILVVLCIVYTISEVSCNNINGTCQALEESCQKDEDCCTENCRRSMFVIKKYCKEPNKIMSSIKNIFTYQIEKGKCLYNKTHDPKFAKYQYRSFGVNAKHSKFSPGTIVEVTYKKTRALIQINNVPLNSTNKDIILELSDEAAQELGIKNEGIVPCTVQVSLYENSALAREFWNLIPLISLFIGILVYSQYVV